MTEQRSPDLPKLQNLVRRLRGSGGCPWDQKQTLQSMRAYLLEEAHEVAAAIDGGDLGELAEELGDLLFQVVFIAELAAGVKDSFLADILDSIHHKMVIRHPHVFGDSVLPDARSVEIAWEKRKLAAGKPGRSVLAGVPGSLPALVASYRISQKAAGVGFDWPHVDEVLAKVREELSEVEEALGQAPGMERQKALEEEVGDLLFSVANLGRHLEIDPEAALAACNRKFRRRFSAIEEQLNADGKRIDQASLEEMEQAWQGVKQREKD
jgi:tetrapyrrole methylase family protein/MazG family protein